MKKFLLTVGFVVAVSGSGRSWGSSDAAADFTLETWNSAFSGNRSKFLELAGPYSEAFDPFSWVQRAVDRFTQSASDTGTFSGGGSGSASHPLEFVKTELETAFEEARRLIVAKNAEKAAKEEALARLTSARAQTARGLAALQERKTGLEVELDAVNASDLASVDALGTLLKNVHAVRTGGDEDLSVFVLNQDASNLRRIFDIVTKSVHLKDITAEIARLTGEDKDLARQIAAINTTAEKDLIAFGRSYFDAHRKLLQLNGAKPTALAEAQRILGGLTIPTEASEVTALKNRVDAEILGDGAAKLAQVTALQAEIGTADLPTALATLRGQIAGADLAGIDGIIADLTTLKAQVNGFIVRAGNGDLNGVGSIADTRTTLAAIDVDAALAAAATKKGELNSASGAAVSAGEGGTPAPVPAPMGAPTAPSPEEPTDETKTDGAASAPVPPTPIMTETAAANTPLDPPTTAVTATAGGASDAAPFSKPKTKDWWKTVTAEEKAVMRQAAGDDVDVRTDNHLKAWVLQQFNYETINSQEGLEAMKDPANWTAKID